MSQICVGCGEMKQKQELEKYKGELLCECCTHQEKLGDEFGKLEHLEANLNDEIMELQSNLEYAREVIKQKEQLVSDARKRYMENELKMVNFNWQ